MVISGSAGSIPQNPILSHALFSANGDVPWTSDNPYLSGNFLPVGRETYAEDLPVMAGRIPPDLSGAYMRNGPNPLFQPLDFAYPMDGDGMVHAVYLDNGRARYRNRFVATPELAVERRAGRSVYGSFTAPRMVDTNLLQPGDPSGPFKNGAFINILSHAGRLLALNEATNCYEMSWDLETIGPWTAGGEKPLRLGAHNRHHPQTGDLFSLAYSVRSPEVQFHRIDGTGQIAQSFSLALAMPTMIHDFILTERHIVLLAGPAVFDLAAAQAGGPMLQWKPDLGMRIAILPLDGSAVQWVETDAFFVFHFANGFERGNQIVVDYVHHASLALAEIGQVSTFRRMVIDPQSGTARDSTFSSLDVEFPRIDERREALPSRYAYMPTLTKETAGGLPPTGLNTLVKCDTETGRLQKHDFGAQMIGEAAFVPRPGGESEEDGYLAVFRYDPATQASDFVLLDARRFEDEPVCIIRLPQRVPQGLHGNWIPKH